MEYYYLTDTGKVRDHNEDNVRIEENNNGDVFLVVADGMGGHNAGEVASNIAVTYAFKKFSEKEVFDSKQEAIEWLQNLSYEMNNLILMYASEHKESSGMGTTFVCALLTNEFLLFGNIGDSSGFVVKKNKLHKITSDHTLVNFLVKSGELTEEEAKDHPRKNVLMKALGANTEVEMDIFKVELNIDGIMLCSDGLTNMLDDEQIAKVLNSDMTIDEKLQKLIYKCNNRGGTDNISIAYLIKEDNEYDS